MDAFQTMMASKDVTIGRVALKHRKQQRFHIVYPDCSDKIVGLEVRKQDLKVSLATSQASTRRHCGRVRREGQWSSLLGIV